jgi:hypothetical protein
VKESWDEKFPTDPRLGRKKHWCDLWEERGRPRASKASLTLTMAKFPHVGLRCDAMRCGEPVKVEG